MAEVHLLLDGAPCVPAGEPGPSAPLPQQPSPAAAGKGGPELLAAAVAAPPPPEDEPGQAMAAFVVMWLEGATSACLHAWAHF